jgi:hypothetical protein
MRVDGEEIQQPDDKKGRESRSGIRGLEVGCCVLFQTRNLARGGCVPHGRAVPWWSLPAKNFALRLTNEGMPAREREIPMA